MSDVTSLDCMEKNTTLAWKDHVQKFIELWMKNETSENVNAAVKFFIAVKIGISNERLLESLKSMDDIVKVLMQREIIGPKDLSLLREMSLGAHCDAKLSNTNVKIDWLLNAALIIDNYEKEYEREKEDRNIETEPICTCGQYQCSPEEKYFQASYPYKNVVLNIPVKDDLDWKLLLRTFPHVKSKWLNVVRNLDGLKEGDIGAARTLYHSKNDPEMEYLSCFRKWKEKYPHKASLENFSTALRKFNFSLDVVVIQMTVNSGGRLIRQMIRNS